MSSLRAFNEAMGPQNQGPASAKRPPNLRLSDEQLEKIPHKEPPKEVTRAEVQQALQKFLDDLALSQKNQHQTVRSTDKVWQADVILHQDLTDDARGPYTPKGGNGHDYDTADLASKIAGQLPDTIPIANYNKFLKLTAKDTILPGSTTDQLHKKYEETRDKIVAKLPEKVRDLARKGMDMAIEKGIPYAVDAALKGAGINSDAEGEMKKVVEDYTKKMTGNNDGGDE